MSIKEFSDQFDVLYNNITSNQAPGLNEYEKSVFLTKAQNEVTKNYFNPKSNSKQQGFDDSAKRQVDFSTLVRTAILSTIDGIGLNAGAKYYLMPSDMFIALNEQLMDGNIPITVVPLSYTEYSRLMSRPYKYPPKYQAWRLITNNVIVQEEATTASVTVGTSPSYTLTTVSSYGKPIRVIVECSSGNSIAPVITESPTLVTIRMVVGKYINGTPVSSTTNYWNLYLNGDRNVTSPYFTSWSGTEGACVWPAIPITEGWDEYTLFDLTNPAGNGETLGTVAEIIGRFTNSIPTYSMRYLRKPCPIILTDLQTEQNDLTIDGMRGPMECELASELHEEILQRAVELAKAAWQGDVQTAITTGQRSE